MHLGSLYTALASYLQARSRQGTWLLRIDDLDTPRNAPGATDAILQTLSSFGLHWDDRVYFQSEQSEAYLAAVQELSRQNITYACICSRKTLRQFSTDNSQQCNIYPGHCRDRRHSHSQPHALRIRIDTDSVVFSDLLQGEVQHHLARQHGDFIIKRRDRIIAYQLAVVVDDHAQRVTEVVRGFDLLDSTPRQIYLQHKLGIASPDYMHVPVITDSQGNKLSKQTHAEAVGARNIGKTLHQLLTLLQQDPPQELQNCPVDELLTWAVGNWQPDRLANIAALGRGID